MLHVGEVVASDLHAGLVRLPSHVVDSQVVLLDHVVHGQTATSDAVEEAQEDPFVVGGGELVEHLPKLVGAL